MPEAVPAYTQMENRQITMTSTRKYHFSQMESNNETAVLDKIVDETDDKVNNGMNNFPTEIYDKMIEYSLSNGKIRNAMFMICMANWGMRYSDVVRVRFGYLFDREGRFKESFTLPNGEQKTKKTVVYYNNEATKAIIGLYLSRYETRKKSRLDFLFVSESGNKNYAAVQQLEAEDMYDPQIEAIIKSLNKYPDMEKRLLRKYAEGKISDDNFNTIIKDIQDEQTELEHRLTELETQKANYVSATPNAENIFIQKPLTHTAGEDIIKNTLKEMGINPKNRKDKSEGQTTDDKYNTHSLRKTFADWFIRTGDMLRNSGELTFNDTILDLLMEKFKHSSRSVTTHYTNAQEEAFKQICFRLNIGLEAIGKYMEGNNNGIL